MAVVIKGADHLLDGAVFLSRRLRVPELLVGLTVVAFGTSLPELVINVLASFRGEAGITVGNIVGSNVANILLILGITALVSPLKSHALILKRELPANLLLVLLLVTLVLLPSSGGLLISRTEGLILLLFFAIYLYLTIFRSKGEGMEVEGVDGTVPKALLRVFGGSVALAFGSEWALDGAVSFAHHLGISEVFVGLFVLAVGTSLPELVTSTLAALRGNPYIALGNVSGSNIFNVAMILGLSALINPISLPRRAVFDVLFLLFATFLFLLFALTGGGKLLGRRRGMVFLSLYALYLFLSIQMEASGGGSPFLALREVLLHLL